MLRADASTRYLVLELSARGPGHIAYLCGIAPPRYGAVLNVGHAHAGEFGGLDQVARAKGELVEALPADGVAILNADDPRVLAMAARTAARVVTFGVAPRPPRTSATRARPTIRAADVRLDDLGRPSFTLLTPEGPGRGHPPAAWRAISCQTPWPPRPSRASSAWAWPTSRTGFPRRWRAAGGGWRSTAGQMG